MHTFLDIIDCRNGTEEIVASSMADKALLRDAVQFRLRRFVHLPIRQGMIMIDSDGRYLIVEVIDDSPTAGSIIVVGVLEWIMED